MKKNIYVIITAIAAVMMFMGGCAKKEQVELTMWCSTDDVNAIVQEFADKFIETHKKEADITIHFGVESEETAGDSIAVNPEIAADIFCIPDDQLYRLHSIGAILPITVDKEQVMELCGGADSAAIDCASIDGELYAVPLTAGNGYFMFYNSDYFTESDVETLDRMLEVADSAGKRISMDWSSGWYTYAFFGGAGLTLDISEDGRQNICNWNATDTAIKGVDVAQAMLDISAHPSFRNCSNDEFLEGIADGSIIAGVNGTWNTELVKESWGDNMRAVKLPTYTVAGQQSQMTSFIGYKLVAVNANTKHPEWAQRFAEYMLDYDMQMRRYRRFGEIPTNAKAAEEQEVLASPAANAIIEQSKYATRQRVAAPFWNPMTHYGTVVAAGNADGLDLQELLDSVVEQITEPVEE